MPGARIASGDRVTLRTVEQEDVPFLQRAGANPELRYPLGARLRNREAIDVSEEEAGTDRFLVCLDGEDAGPGRPDPDDVRRIGAATAEGIDYRRPELGYWLIPAVHGRGYGSEAVGLVVDYLFRSYDTPAVGAGAFDHNDASRGLLESLGFVEEGRRRKFMFVDGAHRDMVQYGLLREEWSDG
ncbi:protein N-acetyltransferase-like protein [Halosimplex carlsbadense 2-9-1]|uniref:Protein N-acetyltransferase-like protein n=1 Tax=Halosimplex carlsbadense 2-9-1 TaxID=797114 RepID=M0CRH6_9EURY|nr:GNAT family protein [Halosimplex carlsbadense]ELZ24987.1 protein N-acetyltransferase-like protein [Halosimplex carlsbadense 2-9-1]